jgi:DNA-binding IclR family transcriptional regulator
MFVSIVDSYVPPPSDPAVALTGRRRAGRPQTNTSEEAGRRTLATGIELLKVVARLAEPASLSDLAQRAEMSPSRVYRYLVTLKRSGFVDQDRATGSYTLGPAALELGLAAFARVDALGIGAEVMRELTSTLGIVSHISVWTSGGPTTVRCEQGHVESALRVREGASSSLVTTATGQIFLAYKDDPELPAILRRDVAAWNATSPPRGRLTATKLAALGKRIREAGVTCVGGMRNPHISALSAPVFDRDGLAMGLTISGITGSFDTGLDGEPARELKDAAARISYRIGGGYDRGAHLPRSLVMTSSRGS